jgi:hypothetical protein
MLVLTTFIDACNNLRVTVNNRIENAGIIFKKITVLENVLVNI